MKNKKVNELCITPNCNNPLKEGLEFAYCEECIILKNIGRINYNPICSFINVLIVSVIMSLASYGGLI